MYNYINPTFQILKFIQDFSATINTTGTEDLHNQNQTVWCPTFLVILEQILTCNWRFGTSNVKRKVKESKLYCCWESSASIIYDESSGREIGDIL
jgi:hypothetical protein